MTYTFKTILILAVSVFATLPALAQEVVYSTGFEETWRPAGWDSWDNNSGNGEDYWATAECRQHSGTQSIWCAAVGDNRDLTECDRYANRMDAYLTSPMVNVAGRVNCQVRYWWMNESESYFDSLFVYHSLNGGAFQRVWAHSGSWTGWQHRVDNLPPGTTSVQIKFVFVTDNSEYMYRGTNIDDFEVVGSVGEPYIVVSPASLDFDSVSVGDFAERPFVIRNVGNATLTVSSVVAVSPFRTSFTGTQHIEPGDSLALVALFEPTQGIDYRNSIRINSNDSDSPVTLIAVHGVGLNPPAPQICLSTGVLSFGIVDLEACSTRTLFVRNCGTDLLEIDSIALSDAAGVFELSDDSTDVEPGDSCAIEVVFCPDEVGEFNGELHVYANVPSSPVSCSLQGEGQFLGMPPVQTSDPIPVISAIRGNFPNPFNPTTTISFDVAQAGEVRLTVFNLLGQEVATLINQTLAVGKYTADWNAANMPSGIYLARLETSGGNYVHKLMLAK